MSKNHRHAFKARLDALYGRVASFSESEPELLSEWAKYLCVLTSGFIEQYVKIIYSDYVTKHANENTARFARIQIDKMQNPKMERICQLAGAFNEEWEKSLRDQTEASLKEAVDSIVANRHLIAHGRDVGLTYIQMREYYAKAYAMLQIIEDQAK